MCGVPMKQVVQSAVAHGTSKNQVGTLAWLIFSYYNHLGLQVKVKRHLRCVFQTPNQRGQRGNCSPEIFKNMFSY